MLKALPASRRYYVMPRTGRCYRMPVLWVAVFTSPAYSGIPVHLKDIQPAALQAGIDEAVKLLEKQLSVRKNDRGFRPPEYAPLSSSLSAMIMNSVTAI